MVSELDGKMKSARSSLASYIDMQRVLLGLTDQKDTSSTSHPHSVGSESVEAILVYNQAKEPHLKYTCIRVDLQATLDDLLAKVERMHPDLQKMGFELKVDEWLLTKDHFHLAVEWLKQEDGMLPMIHVVPRTRELPTFTREAGLKLLHVNAPKPCSLSSSSVTYVPEFNITHAVQQLNMAEKLTCQMRTNWETVGDVVTWLFNTWDMLLPFGPWPLAAPGDLSPAQQESWEADMIGPILLAAVCIHGGFEIHRDVEIRGVCAYGSVGWMLYPDTPGCELYGVLVMKAEPSKSFDHHLGPLAAALAAHRESFASASLGNSKREVAHAMSKLPSYAIITSGHRYQLFKFKHNGKGPQLLQSQILSIDFSPERPDEAVKKQILLIVSVLVQVLGAHMQAIKSFAASTAVEKARAKSTDVESGKLHS